MVSGIKKRSVFTYQEIKDYMNCSLCYHLEYILKEDVPTNYYVQNRRVASDEAILVAISNYYFLHMEGKPPSLKELYKKYYDEFSIKLGLKEKQNFLTDTVTDESIRSTTRNAYRWLRMFYEWNATTPQVVIAINHNFLLRYDELVVEAEFPLIREVENEDGQREIELIVFGQASRSTPEESLVEDMDSTVLLKGFKEAFGVQPDKLLMYSVEKGKAFELYRTESDLKKLENTFLGFYQSLKNVSPHQRIGAHRTSGKFKHLCDTYYD